MAGNTVKTTSKPSNKGKKNNTPNVPKSSKGFGELELEEIEANGTPETNKTVEEKQSKPRSKKPTVAELTKLLEEATSKVKELEVRVKDYNDTLVKRNQDLKAAEDSIKKLQAEGNQKSESIQILNDALAKSYDKNKDLANTNQNIITQNNVLTESIRQSALKSPEEVAQAQKELESTSEPKVDNSAKTEETVTPEGEAKATSEPEVKTEQAQATQEPAKEANTRPGTGEVDEANMMTPEEAFKYLKDNYNDASYAFKDDPTFNSFVDSVSGKWLPRGYFDAYSAKDGINPKNFTFEHFKAKIPDNLREVLSPEKATKARIDQARASEAYDKEYENYNTGFKAYLRRHPKLNKLIKGGGTLGILYGIGQMFNDAYTAGQNDKDKRQMIRESLDDPEYNTGSSINNNINPNNVTATLQGADASTETPEGGSGNIEQVIKEQAPANNVAPANTQVAANAATPTGTATNNVPASTAEPTKPAPTQGTQGLPPVVVNNTPPADAGSNGMTTSQLVEALAPQAGSDAYGDLYNQDFIDFWVKRNPNLAFGVSQGRKA